MELYEVFSVVSRILGNGWVVRSVDRGRWNSGFSFSGDFDDIAEMKNKDIYQRDLTYRILRKRSLSSNYCSGA